MAEIFKYKPDIENGDIIKPEHVSQSVDAFTGATAFDITISGSLTLTGSQNTQGDINGTNKITIGSGHVNTGNFSSINGGCNNTASGNYSTVNGGDSNIASGSCSTVGGGYRNTASGYTSIISGGDRNISSGRCSTVSGGYVNTASGDVTTISGGCNNTASGDYSTVSGGKGNIASSFCSFVGGGNDNTANNDISTVSGGYGNTASGEQTIVGGGAGNTATGGFSSVLGGFINGASGNYSTLSGGYRNIASGNYSTLGGGLVNTASGERSTVGGGSNNAASGCYSSILGGCNNTVNNNNSIALGSNITSDKDNTTFINNLTIADTPVTSSTSVSALVRESNNGEIRVFNGFNRGLYSQTSDGTLITNTTTETTLIGAGIGTLIIPPNNFIVGDNFSGKIGGDLSTNSSSETIQILIKSGAVVLADSGVQTMPNLSNQFFDLNLNFTIRAIGGAGVASIFTMGSMLSRKTTNLNIAGFGFNTLENTNFDTTISNSLSITVKWGAASTNNIIQSQYFTLHKIF